MSHHLVTVCMFCLLCAAHTTCGSHLTRDDPEIADYHIQTVAEPGIEHVDSSDASKRKRNVRRTDSDAYVKQIFHLYGDVENMSINLTGFNNMLRKLDLERLIEGGVQNTEVKEYFYGQSWKKEDVECISSTDLITKINNRLNSHNDEADEHDENVSIGETTLREICPILVYLKLANNSLESSGCVKDYNFRRSKDNTLQPLKNDNRNTLHVWLYSSLSIFVISACGLFGVAVIPIMHKTYYNHILQFLVALAVGTLCGDALLHLLPHAMSPIESELPDAGHHSHDDGMWKGLAAMMGVILFYFTEKGLTVIVEWRKRRQKIDKENKLPSRVRVVKDDVDGDSQSRPAGDNTGSASLLKMFKKNHKGDTTKTCKHKYSEYPYCYDEIETDTHNEHHHRDGQIPPGETPNSNHNALSIVSSNTLNPDAKDEPTAKDWLLRKESSANNVEMNNIKRKEEDKDDKFSDSYTVILREHSRAHHGHSHSHGHVHAPPSSMSSVAWMVIMGDGLHNFTDGMAIGAAFASNIAGGFSTSIAVLCHELPHELGDFAVLLKAGMSVRRALFYNILSSVLCLFGMICGVVAGHTPSATRWLFAVAAGTFLYIALVDMMPELSTSHSKEGTLCQCVLQVLGLAAGIGVMLVIALYEHDLKTLFG